MKTLAAALILVAAGADARAPLAPDYPGCDLAAQHALTGRTGGAITDPRQAHVSVRANILQADLGNAHKAGRLTRATADRLYARVGAVRAAADRDTRRQGFLSAGEVASYDRELDAVAHTACRR